MAVLRIIECPDHQIRAFSLEDGTAGALPSAESIPDPAVVFTPVPRTAAEKKRPELAAYPQRPLGEWDHILSWLVAKPERSSGYIFRELQRGPHRRYQPIQIRALQRGTPKNTSPPL